MWIVDELPALPQMMSSTANIEIRGAPVVFGERRVKSGVVEGLGPTLQHGAHHGSCLFVPAVVTHRPPAAVTMHLHLTRTWVQTSAQPDGSHL